jgi:hypothetical protein
VSDIELRSELQEFNVFFFRVSEEFWSSETIQMNCTQPDISRERNSLTVELSYDKTQLCRNGHFTFDWHSRNYWPESQFGVYFEDFSAMSISMKPQISTADDSLKQISPRQ